MNSIVGPLNSPLPHPQAGRTAKQKEVGDAAVQFEALLISQLLQAARQSSSDGALGTPDSASETARGMAEESLARTMATQGGLGLARMIVSSVSRETDAQSTQVRDAPAAASVD
jgi:Rod binding domain-containing protein